MPVKVYSTKGRPRQEVLTLEATNLDRLMTHVVRQGNTGELIINNKHYMYRPSKEYIQVIASKKLNNPK